MEAASPRIYGAMPESGIQVTSHQSLFPLLLAVLTNPVDLNARIGGSEAVVTGELLLIAFFEMDIDREDAMAGGADRMGDGRAVIEFVARETIGHRGGAGEKPMLSERFAIPIHRREGELRILDTHRLEDFARRERESFGKRFQNQDAGLRPLHLVIHQKLFDIAHDYILASLIS